MAHMGPSLESGHTLLREQRCCGHGARWLHDLLHALVDEAHQRHSLRVVGEKDLLYKIAYDRPVELAHLVNAQGVTYGSGGRFGVCYYATRCLASVSVVHTAGLGPEDEGPATGVALRRHRATTDETSAGDGDSDRIQAAVHVLAHLQAHRALPRHDDCSIEWRHNGPTRACHHGGASLLASLQGWLAEDHFCPITLNGRHLDGWSIVGHHHGSRYASDLRC
mmetsp:Transcript_129244/g.275673  ORF Transcript_129244/g.275673 Transcript_129244/m.275673 type:complete len:222 (-) Transcript_129244:16-681(-)